MVYNYSIIIPHRKSLDTLSRLLNSIPQRKDIEIIVIDNSDTPIKGSDVKTDRDFKLLYTPPSKYAGGARNTGLSIASGQWLIFADADDFFCGNAFDIFDQYKESNKDLIYFKVNSVYDDTLEPNDRGDMFSGIIDSFKKGKIDVMRAKLAYTVPWGKMIKRNLVVEKKIKFDEVIAANDVYFSTLVAYYSNSFEAVDQEVYTVTIRKGSLSRRRDYPVIYSRYIVFLRRNRFLKEHNLSEYQYSIMYHIYNSRRFGIIAVLKFIFIAIKYKQNIFIGAGNWFKTFAATSKEDKRDNKYIVN